MTVGNGSVEYPSCKKKRTVLSIPLVLSDPHHPSSRHVDPCFLFPVSTGPPTDASFEAELLARTRHCQLFIFDHTASALPRGLSTHTTLPARFDEFYAPLDTLSYDDKLDYWDSRHILQRAHFKPYRIAGFDAHGTGDSPKTYTLESLMRQNGVYIFNAPSDFLSLPHPSAR